jgi:hypothetical protein
VPRREPPPPFCKPFPSLMGPHAHPAHRHSP